MTEFVMSRQQGKLERTPSTNRDCIDPRDSDLALMSDATISWCQYHRPALMTASNLLMGSWGVSLGRVT